MYYYNEINKYNIIKLKKINTILNTNLYYQIYKNLYTIYIYSISKGCIRTKESGNAYSNNLIIATVSKTRRQQQQIIINIHQKKKKTINCFLFFSSNY